VTKEDVVNRPVVVAPSVLAADYARLGEQVREAEEAGAEWFQVDVMDGHFVPNLSIGLPVQRSLRRITDAFLDVHLMIDNPEVFLEPFAEAGADLITIHQEVAPHLHRDVHEIRRLGARAGVAINPSTPASTLSEILPFLDLVLVMTVNPGFGGQAFIRSALSKVTQVRRMAAERGLDGLRVQVDGGVDPDTAPLAVDAGADVLVAGSAIFRGEGTVEENYRALERAVAVEV
jgi:ribulose-phosphate 3-epimerase